jgi:hypothetical protein
MTLTIFSLEDEPDTIAGSLDSLEFAGHRIEQRPDLSSARKYLAEHDADLVLLDERVAGHDDGGSTLIAELKGGNLGPRNVDVAFAFVTANSAWVDQDAMSRLPGYLGLRVKGADLTRALEEWIEDLRRLRRSPRPPPPRRVPLRVAEVQRQGNDASHLLLSVPAWNAHEQIAYPVKSLPQFMRADVEVLADSWFIARMNLHEPDPSRIVISDWEPQEPLDDDDGLA